MSDDEKLRYVADIETVKSQLSKSSPNKRIIKIAWESLKALAALYEVSSLLRETGKIMATLFS